MTQAKRVHSTPRRTASKIKTPEFQSAIANVEKSGLRLVPAQKARGKKATLRDYAKIDFKPWTREPGMGPTELIPGDAIWKSHGTACRLAYAIMLRPREELIAMHGKVDHEHVDAMIAEFFNTAEALKQMASMCEAAYGRVLASAASALKRGGKFKFSNKKPGQVTGLAEIISKRRVP